MRLVDYLDKGCSVAPEAPWLTTDGTSITYREGVALTDRIAAALAACGVGAGDRVAIISGNDPLAFATVFGISRAGGVWCPINPRNEADENRELLDLFGCSVVLFASSYADMVDTIHDALPQVHAWICLDAAETPAAWALGWDEFLAVPARGEPPAGAPLVGDAQRIDDTDDTDHIDDTAMIVGTGGTTGRPKGVILTGRNLETMTAITLMAYPFGDRPVYLALAPLTHAAGVLCFPIMTLAGEIVIMRTPDVGRFLGLVAHHRVTHTFLPPTVIYLLLAHPDLDGTDLSSLQCFWYGAAPMSVARLTEALTRIGPVMAQLFGQTEAPMMISTMAPAQHFRADGSVATERLGSAGRPSPLTTVAIMAEDGDLLPPGERGEIVVRGSLVMPGYYRNPQASADAGRHGWHHTGDIGYVDDAGWLFIVDRAKDMIISGGFNVYSTEVEQAVLSHPSVRDCAVVGLPDDKWGERVVAVVQARDGVTVDPAELISHVKHRIGSVKAPKQVEVWQDLPRSKVGKVLKPDIKRRLRGEA